MNKNVIASITACTLILTSGCADTSTKRTDAASSHSISANTAQHSTTNMEKNDGVNKELSSHQLPKLSIKWECGDCAHNEKIIPLIEQEYKNQALAKGYVISNNEVAEVAITGFRQRNPGMRVMFGFMAGSDSLSTRITFRGKELVAQGHTGAAGRGMNFLCEYVTNQAIEQIILNI
jgi:hypothetical protein